MAIITGTNGNDFLTDEPGNASDPGFAKIAPVTKPGAPGGATLPPPGTISYDDTINALDGNDFISVYRGNDTVNGGYGNDTMYDKGDGDDVFNGDDGNDFLYAGKGEDTFNGGAGIDTASYATNTAGIQLSLYDLGGVVIDRGDPRDGFFAHDILNSVENVDGGSGNDQMVGSRTANLLRGLDGRDELVGNSGDDILCGDGGDDVLVGDYHGISRTDPYGRDTLYGGAGNDVLFGDDKVTGNRPVIAGNDDRLVGGTGDDTLVGGDGRDVFIFQARDNFLNHDRIVDFSQYRDERVGLDKIDLSGIDARPDVAGNQAFKLDATADGGGAGEVEFRHAGGRTEVYLSYGDGPADLSILLDGTHNLSASDFIL